MPRRRPLLAPLVFAPLVLAPLVLGACGGAPAPGGEAAVARVEAALIGSEALFRPTAAGATLQWVAAAPLEARVRWGTDATAFAHERVLPAREGACEVVLDGLPAGTHARVELALRAPGDEVWSARPTHAFRTAPAPGARFRVGFVADTHVPALALHEGSAANVAACVERCLADDLDFVVFLGDEAGVHFYGDTADTMDPAAADARWRAWRATYGALLAETPGFLALGNHEGEADFYRDLAAPGGALHLQRWGTAARKRWLANPLPTTYPEGGEDEGWRDPDDASGANASPLQNFFAWTWGDALFVVLDVMRYTRAEPLPLDPDRPAEEVRLGVDDWTLGEAQLAWLERTLRASDAKHKLLFAHHLVGGWGYDHEGLDPDAPYKYGRGGARYARRGEQARLTELMNATGARFFFYGHDHVFAHQAAAGVEFVCCGRPSYLSPGWWRAPGWREAYGDRKEQSARAFLATAGYTRVTVDAERVLIEFVRTAREPVRGENVTPDADGVVYRWDSSQPSPTVELVR
ncbi:MAG: metallophosphoesterase [Planctomycetes bacterium]|nr:metallophosphoesterase [Planctomycetota bacterium]